ncbi:MAG: hypothetical protein IJE25_07200 [Clostridia bacterium]|nr:hypothetical protein [Clostridia bacterium]
MKQREKTTERLVKRDEITDGGINYVYELSVSENKNQASFRLPLYSVCVYMTEPDGTESSSRLDDVFYDAGQALLFYDKVVKNLATPIDLSYILEDEMH